MSSGRISVVIPVYKAARYLSATLESLLEQTYTDWELLAVDDNGQATEDREILEAFRQDNPDRNISLICHEVNSGTATARYNAISKATGDWIAFLDADDIYVPEKLERSLAAFAKYPDCVLVHTKIEVLSEGGVAAEPTEQLFNETFAPGEYRLSEQPTFLAHNQICCPTVMIKRSAIALDQVPSGMCFQFEDWVLWNQVSLAGTFVYLDERLTRYRVHPHSFTENNSKSLRKKDLAYLEMLLSTYRTGLPRTVKARLFHHFNERLMHMVTDEGRRGNGWTVRLDLARHALGNGLTMAWKSLFQSK
jgi:teichuronic acid biosynthesis glycosyltransferase TuaG